MFIYKERLIPSWGRLHFPYFTHKKSKAWRFSKLLTVTQQVRRGAGIQVFSANVLALDQGAVLLSPFYLYLREEFREENNNCGPECWSRLSLALQCASCWWERRTPTCLPSCCVLLSCCPSRTLPGHVLRQWFSSLAAQESLLGTSPGPRPIWIPGSGTSITVGWSSPGDFSVHSRLRLV